jgi:hypothetical protein
MLVSKDAEAVILCAPQVPLDMEMLTEWCHICPLKFDSNIVDDGYEQYKHAIDSTREGQRECITIMT